MAYARGTTVAVEKSKAELERVLVKHGATQRLFGVNDDTSTAFAVFAIDGRQVKLKIPLPKKPERTTAAQAKPWEQICRERWRVMLLLVKAKLETVALGLSTIEREFLADVLLPDGRTVHEEIMQAIAGGYETGKMPPLLGMGGP